MRSRAKHLAVYASGSCCEVVTHLMTNLYYLTSNSARVDERKPGHHAENLVFQLPETERMQRRFRQQMDSQNRSDILLRQV